MSQNPRSYSTGICPKVRINLVWELSTLPHMQDFGTDPEALLFITMGSIPTTTCTWHWDWSQNPLFHYIGINPNYGLYMTLGLIPKSHFLTAGTDPNVTFGQCHLTSLSWSISQPFYFYTIIWNNKIFGSVPPLTFSLPPFPHTKVRCVH